MSQSSGRVEGKVALITGAARGQGRSHAVRLAQEGADVVAVDLAGSISTVDYSLPSTDDLEHTVELVEQEGRAGLAVAADVRDMAALEAAVEAALRKFGKIDVVVANAGILLSDVIWQYSPQAWQDSLDVNLTGVWNTIRSVVPHLVQRGEGGSVVIINSVAGVRAGRGAGAYITAKHGVLGLARSFAVELGEHGIRVNSVLPTSVATEMVLNPTTSRRIRPDLDNPEPKDTASTRMRAHLLPIPWVEPVDVSNAVLWLASDESRYVTGAALPVDAGASIK